MIGCDFCGNARHECDCKERGRALVESIVTKVTVEHLRAFCRMSNRFSGHEWDAMFQEAIAARRVKNGR